ncbi:MAG: hypothetical protein AB8B72_03415 [Crocinitomicaceae bacterium]
MPRLLLLLICLTSFYYTFSQANWTELTGKQKAFFYQLTRKIENLKPEVHHLFEFIDSIPYVNDTLPDYPFIEAEIEKDSSKLICHFSEFARKNRGLLMDIGTHYATWELGLILQFKDSEKPKYQYLKPKIKAFEKLVLEHAPSAAAKMWSEDGYGLSPTVAAYYSPNLTITEKIAAMKNSGYNADEKLSLLNAIFKAQETYIKKIADETVAMLTGQIVNTNNYLIAAGDGKEWSELESIIRTKYNRPLPDPKAFFAYQIEGKRGGKSEEKVVAISQNTIVKMATNEFQNTNLHIDVWAYHPQRQTTLIIQKGGNSYVLFGNNNNRYLSADSTFGEGVTYMSLINELENIWIADLKERIYGKKGFDYLIDLYEKKIVKTRLNIKKTEVTLDKIRHEPIAPPKMKKKKKSRKQRKKGSSVSYQDNQGVPHGKMTKTGKKRKIAQHNLIGYESQLQSELSTLKQLKKDKEEAFDLLAQYEAKLDIMKKNYGYNLMSYTEDRNGFYTYADGTIFNKNTQDLIFKSSGDADYFEVILVSFGKNVMDNNYEEVFIHLNQSTPKNKDLYTLKHNSKAPHSIAPYTISDSIQIAELFKAFNIQKLPLNVVAQVDLEQNVTDSVFGNSVLNQITISNHIQISITGTCNQFQPKTSTKDALKIQAKHPQLALNKIESAVDSKAYFEKWKIELILYAKDWIKDPKEKKKAIKAISKMKLKNIAIDGSIIKV